MQRLNLQHLRKVAGLSQRELADRLAVRPSFLSAIENGKSRFPDDKLDRLKEILMVDDLTPFYEPVNTETSTVPPHTHGYADGDPITELLKHIHTQAHKNDDHHRHGREDELMQRIDYLSGRNDRLSERVDNLRDQVDALRDENLRLKELLARNGIEW